VLLAKGADTEKASAPIFSEKYSPGIATNQKVDHRGIEQLGRLLIRQMADSL
jgi:hypothetical protein